MIQVKQLEVASRSRRGVLPEIVIYNGKQWSRRMIMAYWGISADRYAKLRALYPMKTILLSPDVHSRKGKRLFVDRSSVLIVGNRTYTLAQVYYFFAKWAGGAFTTPYNKWSDQVRSRMKNGLISEKEAIQRAGADYGLANIFDKLAEVDDEAFTKMLHEYREFITSRNERETFYLDEIDDPNDRWEELIAEEKLLQPDWEAYKIKEYDSLKKHNNYLKRVVDDLNVQIINLKQAKASLEKQLMEYLRGSNNAGRWQAVEEREEKEGQ